MTCPFQCRNFHSHLNHYAQGWPVEEFLKILLKNRRQYKKTLAQKYSTDENSDDMAIDQGGNNDEGTQETAMDFDKELGSQVGDSDEEDMELDNNNDNEEEEEEEEEESIEDMYA
jgi:hypothetical protein